MVLLKPGWESSGDSPEIYEPGTAGLMVELDYLDDGRSNIVLRGQYRFHVKREFPSHPYRQALVWPLEEPPRHSSSDDAEDLKRELAELVASLRQRIGRAFPISMPSGTSENASLLSSMCRRKASSTCWPVSCPSAPIEFSRFCAAGVGSWISWSRFAAAVGTQT